MQDENILKNDDIVAWWWWNTMNQNINLEVYSFINCCFDEEESSNLYPDSSCLFEDQLKLFWGGTIEFSLDSLPMQILIRPDISEKAAIRVLRKVAELLDARPGMIAKMAENEESDILRSYEWAEKKQIMQNLLLKNGFTENEISMFRNWAY